MSERGNSTSTTAPMHCTILPSTKAVVLIAFPLDTQFFTRAKAQFRWARPRGSPRSARSDRSGATDDFRQFFRDRGLPALVVHELQFVDDRLRVVRSALHPTHPSRLLRPHLFRAALIHHPSSLTPN